MLNVQRLCNSIEGDVERLGWAGRVPDRLQWEHRQHQKLALLVGRLQGAGEAQRQVVFEGATAAITVGSAAIQVRTALVGGNLPAPIASAAVEAIGLLRDLRSNASAAAERSNELSRLLSAESVGSPHAVELARIAGALQRIGVLLRRHQRFFQHRGAAFRADAPC
jgi:Fusaric acid resistance protein family